MALHFVDDPTASFQGRRSWVRVDFDVPADGQGLLDDHRIRAVLPTLELLRGRGARVILAAHLGLPTKNGPRHGLEPVGARLAELLRDDVRLIDDCIGDGVRKLMGELADGQVLLLENLRFHSGELGDDDAFARQLAAHADNYVLDAWGPAAHAHASVHALQRHVAERRGGLLLKRELDVAARLMTAERPLALVVGGDDVAGKLAALPSVLARVDTLVVGGAAAYTFLKAQGKPVGHSVVDDERLKHAQQVLRVAADRGVRLVLPEDHLVATTAAPGAPAESARVIPDGSVALDLGPGARATFAEALQGARTVVWTGPMGRCEWARFGEGTRAVARAVASRAAEGALSIVGGGTTAWAVREVGLESRVGHLSTGGAIWLDVLAHNTLLGIRALEK